MIESGGEELHHTSCLHPLLCQRDAWPHWKQLVNHWFHEWPGVCHGVFQPRAGRVRRIKRVMYSSAGWSRLWWGYANVISASIPLLSLCIHWNLLVEFWSLKMWNNAALWKKQAHTQSDIPVRKARHSGPPMKVNKSFTEGDTLNHLHLLTLT